MWRYAACMSAQAATSARYKRYRSRRRDGLIVAPVEVDQETIDALVFCTFLDDADRRNRVAVGAAIEGLLDLLAEGELLIDPIAPA